MNSTGRIRLLLVRHGNTFDDGETPRQVGLKTDLPLTAKGRRQAQQMGHWLRAEGGIAPVRFYAGSLQRQRTAAELIAEELGLSSRVRSGEAALDELDYGAWEGLTGEEIKARWPNEYRDWEEAADWPVKVFGGSAAERIERIGLWLERLSREHSAGDTVLAVTSNGVIRFFYYFVPGMWKNLQQKRRMKELKVGTGNFCEVEIRDDCLNVLSWNVKP